MLVMPRELLRERQLVLVVEGVEVWEVVVPELVVLLEVLLWTVKMLAIEVLAIEMGWLRLML